ncbi:MAG: TldD/PmbA family protein [Desulfurococcales archaeon]|nr:TldD/PmbA family protein [Desulfurococcales archaeon]
MEFDLEKILQLGQKKGASEVEVYLTNTIANEITAKKNSIDQAVLEEVTRMGVRVALGKKIGAAGGVISSFRDVEKLLERAISIAKTAQEDKDWPGFNPKIGKASTEPDIYDKKTAELTPEELVKLLQDQIGVITSHENVLLAEGGIASRIVYSYYANTNGEVLDGRATVFGYMLELKSKTAEGEGTFYDYFYKARFVPEKVDETTKNAVEMVLKAAEAKPVETFKGDLILLQDEASSILDVLISPAISAEQAQQGRSPLIGKLDEKVLNERITIVDDPFLPWELGSSSWDDEGHPTSRKLVFENGVFKTFLYDHYTASREGKESTGNASRRSPWSKPSPAPTNLVLTIKGLQKNIDELISDVERGVIVVRTIGSWMSNPVSGQINATVSFGFLVESGSVSRPMKGVVVTDNIYEVLGDRFVGASEPVECRGHVCTPILRARDVTFSGKG